MLVLGLLLVAAAAVAGVELIIANNDTQVTFQMWSWTWHFDVFWLAVIGAAIVTVAWLGLAMMNMGTVHAVRLRRERRRLAKENAMLTRQARVAQPPSTGRTMPSDARVPDTRASDPRTATVPAATAGTAPPASTAPATASVAQSVSPRRNEHVTSTS